MANRQQTGTGTRGGDGRAPGARTSGARSSGGSLPTSTSVLSDTFMAGEDRYRMIAEAAYFRAEQRGFAPGNEIDDWLAAELEVDALLEEDLDRGGRA